MPRATPSFDITVEGRWGTRHLGRRYFCAKCLLQLGIRLNNLEELYILSLVWDTVIVPRGFLPP